MDSQFYHERLRWGGVNYKSLYHWIGIKYVEKKGKWLDYKTNLPPEITNWAPSLIQSNGEPKRQPNEKCAVLNVGVEDKKNHTHYPGYWYPWRCDDNKTDIKVACTVPVDECKFFLCLDYPDKTHISLQCKREQNPTIIIRQIIKTLELSISCMLWVMGQSLMHKRTIFVRAFMVGI